MRTLVIDERLQVAAKISEALASISTVDLRHHTLHLDLNNIDTVVYRPPFIASDIVDVSRAVIDFLSCARKPVAKFVLLSSAAVYAPSAHHEGLVTELRPVPRNDHNRIATSWQDLEAEARSAFADGKTRLTILRSPTVPIRGGDDSINRLLQSRIAFTLPGHDPSIQLLSPQDLAEAIRCVIEKNGEGTYHVAPRQAIPLREALRKAQIHRIPVPRKLQSALMSVLESIGNPIRRDQLDYLRYPWTVAEHRLQNELGLFSKYSSADALHEAVGGTPGYATVPQDFDDFGMDPDYICAYGRTLLTFLERYYWRIEVKGTGNIPERGRAVLVGVHRGFMPWDGVMTLHLIVKAIGRIPRFLVHPTLVKFPFLTNFMTKLGGVIACQDNADYVLRRDELLGVYPEGIQGAFTLYRDAYKLGRFGRHDFVKMALRNRAPIVPFVTVGSAEIFPILAKIENRRWQRYSEWPFFPITPTFPLLPIPLPSKWHTEFLSPMHIERLYPAEAADDAAIVNAISIEVRTRIQNATHEMLRHRKYIFFGSIFQQPSETENADTPSLERPASRRI